MKALEEIESATKKILQEYREDINKGSFSAIIGDDASGRLPALLMWRVLSNVYRNKGFPAPLCRFIAGTTNLESESPEVYKGKVQSMEDQMGRIHTDVLKARGDFPKGKALIVTDTIMFGTTAGRIIDAIKSTDADWQVAIAAIGSDMNPALHERREEQFGARIIFGIKHTPEIYSHKALSGVQKDDRDLFARRIRKPAGISVERQKVPEVARKVIFRMADKMARQYISKNP